MEGAVEQAWGEPQEIVLLPLEPSVFCCISLNSYDKNPVNSNSGLSAYSGKNQQKRAI